MPNETILIVEDEKNIRELLKYNFEQDGYTVHLCSRGDEGLAAAQKLKPDLIVLDLMLPGLDGIEICKSLKQNEKTASIPVIMVTAKSQEYDRILGLELGADDYLTKPFSPRELVARVKGVLRRLNVKPSPERILRAGILEVDTGKHQVTLRSKPVELTSKEYDLLKALMEADGRVLNREYLLEQVWGYHHAENIETRTVDMHIGQLRKKLKQEGERILTIKNVGYRFHAES